MQKALGVDPKVLPLWYIAVAYYQWQHCYQIPDALPIPLLQCDHCMAHYLRACCRRGKCGVVKLPSKLVEARKRSSQQNSLTIYSTFLFKWTTMRGHLDGFLGEVNTQDGVVGRDTVSYRSLIWASGLLDFSFDWSSQSHQIELI